MDQNITFTVISYFKIIVLLYYDGMGFDRDLLLLQIRFEMSVRYMTFDKSKVK